MELGALLEEEEEEGLGTASFFSSSTQACFWRGGCLHADDAICLPPRQSQAARVSPSPLRSSLSECDCSFPRPSRFSLGDQGTTKPVTETASCHSHFSLAPIRLRPAIHLSTVMVI